MSHPDYQATFDWFKKTTHSEDKVCDAFALEYSIGDEMYLDDNYCECALYTVGNHRCDCGNRRVGIEVGELLNGKFYFQTTVG
jgi:hypothetical protein